MRIGRSAAWLAGVTALALVVLSSPTVSARTSWSPPDRALGVVRAHHPHGSLGYQDASEVCAACVRTKTQRYPYNNWAAAPRYTVGVDQRGRIKVAQARRHRLVLLTYTSTGTKRIARSKDGYGKGWRFGASYFAPDGYLYVLLGRNNPHQRDGRVVLKVRKYGGKLGRIGTARYRSGQAPGGIYKPFSFSSSSLSQVGGRVVASFGREMYADSSGIHHQAGESLVVRTDTMSARHFEAPAASHQFNQVARTPGDGKAYLVEHGDAYPRSLYLGEKSFGSASASGFSIFDITGPTGDNFTGTTLNGFDIAGGRAIAVGVSVPHRHAVDGVTGDGTELMPNAYLISSALTSGDVRFRWLTTFDPRTARPIVGQPSLTSLGDGRFVVLFNVSKGKRVSYTDYYRRRNATHYLLVGNRGRVQAQRTWRGKQHLPLSQPVLVGDRLFWVALFRKKTSSGALRGGAYLAGLDLSSPAAPSILRR